MCHLFIWNFIPRNVLRDRDGDIFVVDLLQPFGQKASQVEVGDAV